MSFSSVTTPYICFSKAKTLCYLDLPSKLMCVACLTLRGCFWTQFFSCQTKTGRNSWIRSKYHFKWARVWTCTKSIRQWLYGIWYLRHVVLDFARIVDKKFAQVNSRCSVSEIIWKLFWRGYWMVFRWLNLVNFHENISVDFYLQHQPSGDYYWECIFVKYNFSK